MDQWSRFELNGWTFRAMMPSNDEETQQWTVKVTDPKGNQRALYIPMDYAPRFGPDMADVDRLNVAVDEFVKSQGIES
jgi:allophanate hydrolase subunit 1